MILLLVLYLLYIGMYCSFGAVEAILWARKGADAFPWDEHDFILTPQRVWFGLIVVVTNLVSLKIMNLDPTWILGISLPAFFFFHQGTMYMVRNLINDKVYPKRWFDDSTTSTANINITVKWRIVGLILSVLLLIGLICLRSFL